MSFSINSAHKQAQITCVIINQNQIFMSFCVLMFTLLIKILRAPTASLL